MANNIERRCTELFGRCPLKVQDLAVSESLRQSEEELLFAAALKHYRSEQRDFFYALCDWKDGNKMDLTQDEAEERNRYFENAQMIVDERISTSADTLVDWTAFPRDDPTICYYIGLPFDDELCVWAENY